LPEHTRRIFPYLVGPFLDMKLRFSYIQLTQEQAIIENDKIIEGLI